MQIEKSKLLALVIFSSFILSLGNFSFAQGCVKAQPTITISPTDLSGTPESTVAYDLSVKNNDSPLCSSSIFSIAATASGFTTSLSKNSVTLLPGEETKALLNVIIPSNAVSGTKDISVTTFSGNFQATTTAKLTIVEVPKSCTLSVDSIEVSEKDDNTPKNLFCEDLTLKVKTRVSVSGDTGTSALVQLYVAGNLFDTRNVVLSPGSFAGFTFNRLVDTKTFGLNSFDIKVVAKSSCDVDGAELSQSVSTESCKDKCEFSISVPKPSDAAINEKVSMRILVKNVGGIDDEAVTISTFMCKSDEDECKVMKCESSSFSVNHGELKSILCSTTADKEGTYKIKLSSVTCGKVNTDFSNDFIVSTSSAAISSCDQNLANQARCSGNVIQKSSLKTDCSVEWNDVEYCPFGCSDGKCSSIVEVPAREAATSAQVEKTSTTQVSTQQTQAPQQTPFVELGEIAVLVIAIIFILYALPKKIFE